MGVRNALHFYGVASKEFERSMVFYFLEFRILDALHARKPLAPQFHHPRHRSR